MPEINQIPDNVPVSWLQKLNGNELSDESLFLVSQPDSQTETEYMSRYVTYRDLKNAMTTQLDINKINEDMATLCSQMLREDEFLRTKVIVDTVNPYIVSSLTQGVETLDDGTRRIGILSADGYRLSSAINNYATKVMMKNCAAGEETASMQQTLNIQVMTDEQLESLCTQGLVEKNTIYLTYRD